jgi:quercetin dioxygenase-like cupin family protein
MDPQSRAQHDKPLKQRTKGTENPTETVVIDNLRMYRRALSRRLRDWRKLERKSLEDVQNELEKIFHVVESQDQTRWILKQVHEELREHGVAWLERDDPVFIDLSIASLEVIAYAYGIHPLLLDPLLAVDVQVDCVVQGCTDFVEVSQLEGATSYGYRAHYSFPTSRLSGMDNAAIVWLQLDPGGYSDVHHHGGTEFIWAKKGTIEVRFPDSGLWTPLNEGDFAHYYAEQTHGAWSVKECGESAEVFIIRFDPSVASGSRHQLVTNVRGEKWTRDIKARVVAELQALLVPSPIPRPAANEDRELSLASDYTVGLGSLLQRIASQRSNSQSHGRSTSDFIGDRFGLGRLLQLLASEGFRGQGNALSLGDLANRAKGTSEQGTQEDRYSRSKLDRIQHGQAPVSLVDLEHLARLYEVEPFLLYDYLHPALRPAIAVRHGLHPSNDEAEEDWSELPASYLREQGVRYFIPKRRLADSDTSISIVELERAMSTPQNRHPGFEILVPLKGRLRIKFGGGDGYVLDEREHRFAQFDSSRVHQVTNDSAIDTARFLVVRFYE